MRKFYLASLLLVLSWLVAPAGWAQTFTAGFDTAPDYSCSTSGNARQPNCFQVTLNGVVYVFAFTPDGGGGSFLHINTGGVGNGPSMDLESKVFDVTTSERVTITRLDGGTFAFSSIYVDHLEKATVAKEPVTVQPFLMGAPAAAAQTVLEGGKQTLVFNGAITSSVQITCDDFYEISLDNFSVCVPPSVSFNAAGLCLGTATNFTSTSTSVLPGATYQWDFNNDDVVDATSPNASFTYPAAGTYLAKLTISQGGCVGSFTKSVTISARPTAVLSGGGTVCAGTSSTLSIALTGTPPWSVTYTDGTMPVTQSNVLASPYVFSVSPASSKTYTLTAVANASCAGTVSGSAPVTVSTLPNIVNQSTGATKCIGEPVAFSVTATGSGLTYQWKKNGNDIPGATGTSYSIPSVATGDAGTYTVQVTGTCGTPLVSGGAVLNVNQPPSITSQPESATVCQGSSASFTVTASNAASYQWQVNTGSGFVNVANSGFYSGVNTATLSITGAAPAMNGYQYRLVATSSCPPSVITNVVTLGVNSQTLITAAPVGATKCVGEPVAFSVTATGSSLSYQWQKNGSNIAGATNSTFSIASASLADAGSYTVQVTGACGTPLTSEGAALSVNQLPALTSQPESATVCQGGSTAFSAGIDNATGYQWQVNTGSGFVNLSEGGAHSGVNTATLSITGAAPAMNGYQYRLVATSSCPPSVTSNVVTLGVNSQTLITAAPVGATKCVGEPVAFSVTATGSSLSYQWQKNGSNIAGATNSTYSIASASLADAGSYTVQVTGACGTPLTSEGAALSVNQLPALTSQPENATICQGGSASFTVTASNATSYQWQVDTGSGFINVANNAIYNGATTGTLSVTGATAGMNGYQYRAVVTGACPPTAISNVAALAVGTPVTITRVNMLRGVCAGGPIDFNVEATGTDLTYQWKKNGNDIPGATGSSFSIAETTIDDSGFYTVTVSGACGAPVTSGSVPVQYEVPPAITSQPAPVAICTGTNASFSVGASNATGYQWQVNTGSGFVNLTNSSLYSGVNTPTLLITAATTALNGYQYRAIASGACPTVATSNGAKLSVGTSTALGAFTPLTAPVLVGSSVKMTISFTGDAPASAVWNWGDGTSSNATVVGSTLTGTHVYATQNVYAPSITVTSCGVTATQVYQYVVVYDPNGGFITGGGWFNSPAGAYRPQPSLEGRVNFGFVSKYKKGTTVPDGRTEFQYRMGNLSFQSTAYEWLVISGAKGQFKGSGTINGTGNYGFILTAIDGGKRPDRLRMKIWNKANNALVYDNQLGASDTADPATVINGGSILIKAPSKAAREGVDTAEAGAVLSSGGSAYPNPFRDRVTVDLSGLKPGKVRLDLVDAQGNSVHRQDVELERNQSGVELELGHLKQGMYLLQARGNGDRKFIKLMKL